MGYRISGTCPETVIVQHFESGEAQDFTEFGTVDDAAESIMSDFWIDEDGSQSRDDALTETVNTLSEYSQADIMAAVEAGYHWPIELGFVTMIDV